MLTIDGVPYPNASVTILTNQPSVHPVTPPVVPPSPPPPVYVPPPPVYRGVVPWDLHTVQLWPVPPLSGVGDEGLSVSFVADNAKFPRGITIGGVDEHQPTIGKDYVISTMPYNFNPVGPAGIKQGAGTTMGPMYVWFGVPQGVTPKPYQLVLNPGQTYYLNVREYKDPSDPTPRGAVYSQFICYDRIE